MCSIGRDVMVEPSPVDDLWCLGWGVAIFEARRDVWHRFAAKLQRGGRHCAFEVLPERQETAVGDSVDDERS